MNAKKFLALLLALLMLLTIFSACAKDDAKDDVSDKTEVGDKKDTDSAKDEDVADQPEEQELRTIHWLGSENAQWPHPMEEAKDFETWKQMMATLRDSYGVDWQYETVYSDAYATTLNGLIASNSLPDAFNAQGVVDDTTFNQMIANGMLAPLDDVLEYSDGSSKAYYNDEDAMLYLKSWAMTADGNWYHVRSANSVGMAIDFSNSKYDMRAPGQVHGAYAMNIRQDWLDDLGLSMPGTLDEFYQAIEKFQAEDVNGNGAADERIVTGLGNTWQLQGVGQWFGLPWEEFMEDPATGQVELSFLTEGYDDFVTFMNKVYSNQLVAIEGGHPWATYAPLVGGDYVSAIHMMPDYIWNAPTGDPDSLYQPMPIIQAVDGVEPRLLVQESVAANNGFSFSSACDYQAAASFLDYVNSKEFFMLYEYGIEGVAYDWNDDGVSLTVYPLGDDKVGYASPRTMFLNGNGMPNPANGNVHDVRVVTYANVEEALAAGEPYYEIFTTREGWQDAFGVGPDVQLPTQTVLENLLVFGQENYHPAAYYSYRTLSTDEEAAIQAQYKADLTTYILEMTTNLIVGTNTVDEIDGMVQYMKDNLGLKEYYNVMQTRLNRYLVAMGREAAPLMD